jgi:hypothetical protein
MGCGRPGQGTFSPPGRRRWRPPYVPAWAASETETPTADAATRREEAPAGFHRPRERSEPREAIGSPTPPCHVGRGRGIGRFPTAQQGAQREPVLQNFRYRDAAAPQLSSAVGSPIRVATELQLARRTFWHPARSRRPLASHERRPVPHTSEQGRPGRVSMAGMRESNQSAARLAPVPVPASAMSDHVQAQSTYALRQQARSS